MSAIIVQEMIELALIAKGEKEFGLANIIANTLVVAFIEGDPAIAVELRTQDEKGTQPFQSYYDKIVIAVQNEQARYLVVPLPCVEPSLAVDIVKATMREKLVRFADGPTSEPKVAEFPFERNFEREWMDIRRVSHWYDFALQQGKWEGFDEGRPRLGASVEEAADLRKEMDEAWERLDWEVTDSRLLQMSRRLLEIVEESPALRRSLTEVGQSYAHVDFGTDQSRNLRATNVRARAAFATLLAEDQEA